MQQSLLDRVAERLAQAKDGTLKRSAAEEILTEVHEYLEAEQARAKQQAKTAAAEQEEQRLARIHLTVGTLTHSELEALKALVPHLEENESGLLVASKIADATGVTRSVIVNALRKLESAGIIRSQSLGMKGTRIDTKVPGWTKQLEHRRKVAA